MNRNAQGKHIPGSRQTQASYQDPPDVRARRRAWTAGMFGVEVVGGGEEYLSVWENTKPRPTVWYLGDPSSLAR